MATSTTLLQFLLMVVAGWLQRQQAATIDYLKAENRMLRARLGGRRIVFTDAERRQLAEKARALGRKALHELGTIVTPETLLRWHRELVARKWTFVERRNLGRPRIREELVALVVRMAKDNRGWGYTRIQGAMANLGHKLGRATIGLCSANIRSGQLGRERIFVMQAAQYRLDAQHRAPADSMPG